MKSSRYHHIAALRRQQEQARREAKSGPPQAQNMPCSITPESAAMSQRSWIREQYVPERHAIARRVRLLRSAETWQSLPAAAHHMLRIHSSIVLLSEALRGPKHNMQEEDAIRQTLAQARRVYNALHLRAHRRGWV